MSEKNIGIFLTNFIGGLFIGLGIDDPETTIINSMDPVFKSLNNEAGLIWFLVKILIVILGIVELIYLFNDSKTRTVIILGLISGILIVNPLLNSLGAFFLIVGLLISKYL